MLWLWDPGLLLLESQGDIVSPQCVWRIPQSYGFVVGWKDFSSWKVYTLEDIPECVYHSSSPEASSKIAIHIVHIML